MNVVFQGERGAFSEVMASMLFNDVAFVSCRTLKQVFDRVNSGEAEFGVIPVENSLTGRISEATDLLIAYDLNVFGEGMLNIIHCLIANEKVSEKDLKQIYAHPEALIQCRKILSKSNCELISWYDGAAAAKIVKKKKSAGLIASEKVAKIYGLKILRKGIQDSKENITRFFMISKETTSSTGNDKTSVVFSTKHEPGALFHALKPFVKENINLTRLESMPSKEKPWEYLFLIDFKGHKEDSEVKNALQKLNKHATSVQVLGSYSFGKSHEKRKISGVDI